jgi:hypothetical protein
MNHAILPNLKLRSDIVVMEHLLNTGIEEGSLEDIKEHLPLDHFFTPVSEEYGCTQYARQAFMPAGSIGVGKLHKLPHLTFLMKGRVLVISEAGGREEMVAPLTFVSPAGTKRAYHALEDTILTTVHVTRETSEETLDLVEGELISPTYSAMGLEDPDISGLEDYLKSQQEIEEE